MTTKQKYAQIKKFNGYEGRLGFAIAESVNDYNLSYESIGEGLDYIIRKNPDKIDFVEDVVAALTGYDFEELRNIIREQKDYYDAL